MAKALSSGTRRLTARSCCGAQENVRQQRKQMTDHWSRSFRRWGLAALAAAGGMALLNHLVARRTDKHHPPEGLFIDVDGIRVSYSDRGEGTPVVLIHGNVVTGDDWNTSGVADLLLTGHRVIIFDRPGFGYSDRPLGSMWTADQQAELLHKALLQLNVERPILVGHSWGTLVALALAIRHQEAIAGLVLVSGYYFWTARPDVPLAALSALPVIGALLRYTISPLLGWLQMPLIKRGMFSPVSVPDRFEAEFSTAMALRPSQIRATAMDGGQMITSALAMRDQYKHLTLPVTIIAGAGDRVVFKRMSERLAVAIPHSVLKIIEGAGHMVHYVAPREVAQAVDAVRVRTRQLEAV
jgi:pimeloyl-ACP methyl ester carboxylesterase